MLTVDVYWSFRSPYSYIVTPRLVALARDFDVDIRMRIVQPAAIRNPDYFRHMNPLARPYFLRDGKRAAEFHNLPFRRPVPDPIVQDQTTLRIADEQPYIFRISRLGVVAVEMGKGLSYCSEVSTMLWDGRTDNWHEGDHLAQAARRAGLDPAALEAIVAAEPERLDEQLRKNDEALRAAGHWGVPTMVFDGEPFFGQDRFDMLVWRLRQNGLRARGH